MSDDDRPVISAAQVAVLASKVDNMLENFAELKGMLVGMSQQYNGLNGIVIQMAEKVAQLERDNTASKDTAYHQGKAMGNMKDELTKHSTIWKLCGSAVGIVIAVAAWNFNTLRSLEQEDQRHERRIIVLEMRVDRGAPLPKSQPDLETPR